MENLLKEISNLAIQLGDFEFTNNQIENNWLGTSSATTEAIEKKELELKVKLPQDYIEFLKISNGFPPTSAVDSTFLPIEEIGLLKEKDKQLVDIWCNSGNGINEELQNAILVTKVHEEQYFLLIPPITKNNSWQYWKFASWIPGEEPYKNIESYFQSIKEFIQDEL
tara:strand:- start:62 stop:562 length:501 start_codon:yes stop_codon:yes gene_type:complete